MTVSVPEGPTSAVTAESLATRFNLTVEGEGQRVYDVALSELNDALVGAFRDVSPAKYDDMFLKVAGAVVGSKRRPTNAGGSLTTVQAVEAPATPRDYLWPIRSQLARLVAPL